MRHINKIIIKQATESRAASSCGSDVDRQELINNYGNEKYLSKWGIEDSIPPPCIQPSDELKLGKSEELQELHLSADDDNASLVSYNSVRDGTPFKNTTYLPYQVQQPSQDITLWQGYSGNIYFDSVRCRSLRINSSKPNKEKTKKGKSSSHRLTKSCSPSIGVHALNNNNVITYSTSSFYSLGSLRISSREEKKKFIPFKTNQFQYSKLRKGFVEIEERNVRRTHSTPTSLVISGGQMNGKTDPIDSVYRINTKIRSSPKNREGSGLCDQSFPSINGDNTKTNAQVSESSGDAANCGEQHFQYASLPQVICVPGKEISEPTPVFIIPFATLDDPVDADINDHKTEKRPSIESEKEMTRSLQKPMKMVLKNRDKPDKPVLQKPEKPVLQKSVQKPVIQQRTSPVMQKSDKSETSVHVEGKPKECRLQQTQPVPTHIVNITCSDNIPQVSPRPDFSIRREISNSSLSNYLRAVPQRKKTEAVKDKKKSMPKLTYTQRARELCSTEMETNNTFSEQPNGLLRTEALYGGYLPSTRAAQNFHAELLSETTSDSSAVTSPSRREKHHVTKSILKRTGVKNNGTKVNGKFHLPVIGWNVT